jgi:hypothetical protein
MFSCAAARRRRGTCSAYGALRPGREVTQLRVGARRSDERETERPTLYLSQRIIVLSSHPGRVIAEIDVPFGGGRGPDIKRDVRFLDLRDEIQDRLLTRAEAAA